MCVQKKKKKSRCWNKKYEGVPLGKDSQKDLL